MNSLDRDTLTVGSKCYWVDRYSKDPRIIRILGEFRVMGMKEQIDGTSRTCKALIKEMDRFPDEFTPCSLESSATSVSSAPSITPSLVDQIKRAINNAPVKTVTMTAVVVGAAFVGHQVAAAYPPPVCVPLNGGPVDRLIQQCRPALSDTRSVTISDICLQNMDNKEKINGLLRRIRLTFDKNQDITMQQYSIQPDENAYMVMWEREIALVNEVIIANRCLNETGVSAGDVHTYQVFTRTCPLFMFRSIFAENEGGDWEVQEIWTTDNTSLQSVEISKLKKNARMKTSYDVFCAFVDAIVNKITLPSHDLPLSYKILRKVYNARNV